MNVPILSVLIGEGGSGGALALAVADRVWMLENAVYSVISPEGCASILFKDSKKAKEAAECLKLTAEDALSFGLIERIIDENALGTEEFFNRLASEIEKEILSIKEDRDYKENRYRRFRAF